MLTAEMDAKKIGKKLMELRVSKKESREQVATAIGASVSAISMYENGDRIPRDSTKIMFARYFGKTVQEIFFD